MTVVRFVFRNWPLKLGAILLAVILYAGMLVLQNAGAWSNQIPIVPVNQPTDSALLSPLPNVTQIRYVAPGDVPVTRSSFKATADLSAVQPGKQTLVKVEVSANDPRITVLDYDPQQISVMLDPLIRKSMQVTVQHSAIPAGLTIDEQPTVTPSEVTMVGPASYVKQVVTAQASVYIEPSGLDVDQDPLLNALDQKGNIVSGVEFQPPTVHVHWAVNSQTRTVSLPVNPVVTGSPAGGYVVSSVDVQPAVVEVRGEVDSLASLRKIDTKAISIANATSDVTQQVPLSLPPGVDAPGVTTVKVVVHVQALTGTRTISIGVVPDGARADRIYQLSTPNVTLTIGGLTATLNVFDTSTLTATVSVATLDVGQHTAQVSVSLPANVRLVSIEPASIGVNVIAVAPSPSPTGTPAPT